MKTSIGASLPKDLYKEFLVRAQGFPGGKSALIREALRTMFIAVPMSPEQNEIMAAMPDPVDPKKTNQGEQPTA